MKKFLAIFSLPLLLMLSSYTAMLASWASTVDAPSFGGHRPPESDQKAASETVVDPPPPPVANSRTGGEIDLLSIRGR